MYYIGKKLLQYYDYFINTVNTDSLGLYHQWPLLLTWFNFDPSMDK